MILDPILDLFRGRSVTIPPMDGALRPNTTLDQAEMVRPATAPDSLAVLGGDVVYASGRQIFRLSDGGLLRSFDHEVSALASSGSGRLAVGLADGTVRIDDAAPVAFGCPVALALDEEALYVCNGSGHHPPGDWSADLLEKRAGGSLWRIDLGSGERLRLADRLAFPYGLAVDTANDRLIVAESWRHRLVGVPLAGGEPRVLLAELPGYPARLAPDGRGGYLMALFAPRNRLIEFVLQEDAYRDDMMRTVDPRHWIAPTLSPSRSFLEPLQNGGVRTMGIHKPWAPTRSYGLVVELDATLQPVASHHSRADGLRHGVTSVIAWQGAILAASKGGDCILQLPRGEVPQ